MRGHVFPEHPGYGLSHSPCCRYAQITPLWPVGGFQRLRGRPPRAQAARAVPSRSVPLFPGTARCSGPRVHVPPALYTRPRLQGAPATLIGERCQKMKTRELGVLAAAGRSPRAGVADGAPGASGTRAPPRERPPATLCSTRNECIGSYASPALTQGRLGRCGLRPGGSTNSGRPHTVPSQRGRVAASELLTPEPSGSNVLDQNRSFPKSPSGL